MTNFMKSLSVTIALASALPAIASDCPKAVTTSVEKAHAKSKIVSCSSEREHETLFYEVKIRTAEGGKLEMELSPDGAVPVTEERIAVGEIPAAVMNALRAAHTDAELTGAERHTSGDGKVSFELQFKSAGREHEMTVSAAGAVLEGDDDHDTDDHDTAESATDGEGHD